MERNIKTCTAPYKTAALDLIETVFTEHENAGEGKLVRRLAEEIRAKEYYVPELELIMTDGADEVVGYAMFSRFHLEGRYADELLLLSPVAVKTTLQRQHISKELIEYGLERARGLGYKAVLVEGDPRDYRPRGLKRRRTTASARAQICTCPTSTVSWCGSSSPAALRISTASSIMGFTRR